MSLQLDKIDSAPILGNDMPAEFLQWIWVLIDSLNENIDDLELTVSSLDVSTMASVPIDINSVNIPTNTGQTVYTLPVEIAVGTRFEIDGEGAGGWQLLTNPAALTPQTIQLAQTGSTAMTSVTSSSRYDSISIICVVANTTMIVVSQSTTGFVIV